MYLLDTNVWLERMLDQKKSEEVGMFLSRMPSDRIFMTDFTLHSIGVILHRLNKHATFLRFIQDVFENGEVGLVSLTPADMTHIVAMINRFRLDFDDAYQYVAAEKYEMVLVSFDSDFDQTLRGRSTPDEIVT